MPRSDSDRDDIFFDAFDDIRSEREPSLSDDCSTSDEGLTPRKFEYDIWANEPLSVQERRQRFLTGMGLDEFVASRVDFCEPMGEITDLASSADLEDRSISDISSLNSYLRENESVFDATCCVRDLDCGKRYIVHNSMHGELTNILKEVASDKMMSLVEFQSLLGISRYVQNLLQRMCNSHKGEVKEDTGRKRKVIKSSWKSFMKNRIFGGICKHDVHVKDCTTGMPSRTKVQHRNKKISEFSVVYMGQQIQAHKGLIRAMKFSPSGWYLATGGEDCVVRIWQITEVDASPKLCGGGNILKLAKGENHALAVMPKKIFHISETPLHEFHGHRNDILDMAWSKSDYLLTSSKDKTVRLWKVGCDGSLAVLKHNDYVTSIQFNPTDERYFISGSIDGKVRIWDVLEKRVVDWADTRNIITAVSYQPDGKGFIVGTTAGGCRFYDQNGDDIQLDRELFMQRKKSAASRINSLQFCTSDSPKIIVSSADSKIRVADGVDITQKFKGPWKSKALSSPSLTSDGRYLISAGKDSNVYIWNFGISGSTMHKREAKSVRSCEMFFSKDVTIAVPWPGVHQNRRARPSCLTEKPVGSPTLHHHADCRSPGSWFFTDNMRGSMTWPEEKLPSAKPANGPQIADCLSTISAAWNAVIVTASRDGIIRSFHNYGLPVRL